MFGNKAFTTLINQIESIKKDEALDLDTIFALKETVVVLHLLRNIGYVADKRVANHVPTRSDICTQ